MSDIGFQGLAWGLVALVTTGVCGLGLALQPIVVLLVRRGKGASTRHVLGAFVGPLLATITGALALYVVDHVSLETKATLDELVPLLPIVALVLWVAPTALLLWPRR